MTCGELMLSWQLKMLSRIEMNPFTGLRTRITGLQMTNYDTLKSVPRFVGITATILSLGNFLFAAQFLSDCYTGRKSTELASISMTIGFSPSWGILLWGLLVSYKKWPHSLWLRPTSRAHFVTNYLVIGTLSHYIEIHFLMTTIAIFKKMLMFFTLRCNFYW